MIGTGVNVTSVAGLPRAIQAILVSPGDAYHTLYLVKEYKQSQGVKNDSS